MTNSQKVIEAAFDSWASPEIRQHYLYGNIFIGFQGGWRACNAMWERKLDEGVVTGVIFRAIRDGGGICELDDANGVAQAIIKHIKGE